MRVMYGEGWDIYLQSLSGYYLIAVATTAIALFISFFYTSHARKEINRRINDRQHDFDPDVVFDKEPDYVQDCVNNSRIKSTQAIANQLCANMTAEQLQEEKEIEKMQLEAIYNLLREQKDKFQVSNIEEVEEQLGLYR